MNNSGGLQFSHSALRIFESVFDIQRGFGLADTLMAALPVGIDSGRPVILAANHMSWWDGFLLLDVYRKLGRHVPLHTLMSRAELDPRPFFRLLGAVAIERDSPASIRSAIRAVRAQGIAFPEMVLSYFPQGKIWPSRRRPLGFLGGLELFAAALAPCTILPVGLHVEPLNRRAPTAFISFGTPIHADEGSFRVADVEREVEGCLDELLSFVEEFGEDAPARWMDLKAAASLHNPVRLMRVRS